MRYHSDYFKILGAKMKAPVPTFGKSVPFSLPLGKKAVQGYVPCGKNAQVPMHGQYILLLLQSTGHPNGNGFLAYPTEPFGNSALSQKKQHFLLDQARLQHSQIKS
jgi:hypothetical protein